jgi:hypothetical protein
MAFSRYNRTTVIALGAQYGTAEVSQVIRNGIKQGTITVVKQIILNGVERLDTIAGFEYGDGRYWWVIAAASDIGWGMQLPAGTVLNIPSLKDIARLVG